MTDEVRSRRLRDISVSARRLRPDDLRQIDKMVRIAGSRVEWAIHDGGGEHEGRVLGPILERVAWTTITHFDVRMWLRRDCIIAVDTTRYSNDPITIHYAVDAAAGEDRAAIERLAGQLKEFLEQLPAVESWDNEYVLPPDRRVVYSVPVVGVASADPVNDPEPQTSHAQTPAPDIMLASDTSTKSSRPWWDPRRSPYSIIDQIVVGVIVVVAGAVLLYVVSKLA